MRRTYLTATLPAVVHFGLIVTSRGVLFNAQLWGAMRIMNGYLIRHWPGDAASSMIVQCGIDGGLP